MRNATGLSASMIAVLLWTAAPAAQQVPPRTPEQRKLAYQISTMESVLARAVEHGASVVREHLQAAIPAQMLMNDSAKVRGFPLAGYGMLFDVAVPGLDGTIPWSFRTLQQQDRDVEWALTTLRESIEKLNDPEAAQALQRIEFQVSPITPAIESTADAGPARRTSTFELAPAPPQARRTEPLRDPVLRNPDEFYRSEIRNALMDAMLDHSLPLNLGPEERLTVNAKSNEDLLLGSAPPDARTTQITVTGADLAAFRAGQISRDEARARMTVTVF